VEARSTLLRGVFILLVALASLSALMRKPEVALGAHTGADIPSLRAEALVRDALWKPRTGELATFQRGRRALQSHIGLTRGSTATAVSSIRGTSSRRHVVPKVHAAQSASTVAQIALPQSVLQSGDTQDLVGPKTGNWQWMHSDWTGYMGGVEANLQVGAVSFAYRGSVFTDTESAYQYWRDGAENVSALTSNTATLCSSSWGGRPCVIGTYSAGQDSTTFEGLFLTIAVNTCVIEVGALAPTSTFDSIPSDIGKATGALEEIGVAEAETACPATPPASTPSGPATPTVTPLPIPTATAYPIPTPTPHATTPDFTFDSVRVQTKNQAGAANVKHVPVGRTVYIYMYWTVRSLPLGSQPQFSYQATESVHGKTKTLSQSTMQGTLSAYPPQAYTEVFHLRLSHKGTVHIVAAVKDAGASQQAITLVTVT
jgi:hypothetical protein